MPEQYSNLYLNKVSGNKDNRSGLEKKKITNEISNYGTTQSSSPPCATSIFLGGSEPEPGVCVSDSMKTPRVLLHTTEFCMIASRVKPLVFTLY